MAICIYQDIAEHRAELAHSLLSKRECAELTKRLSRLLEDAAAKEAEAYASVSVSSLSDYGLHKTHSKRL